MADSYVRVVGFVEDIDGRQIGIGVEYDAVTIGDRRLALGAVEELAQLIVSATWEASRNLPPP